MSEHNEPVPALGSLRYERDVREHGAAVTTRPWWNAPGEESRADLPIEETANLLWFAGVEPRPF